MAKRFIHRRKLLADQLQGALESRVTIEWANRILANALSITHRVNRPVPGGRFAG